VKKLLLILGFLAGTAHAADEYYSIQPGSVAADVGGITATGFFETNGFGTSGYDPSTKTYNPVVIGVDITLSYEGTSFTICGGQGYGCQQNDALLPVSGILATSKGLFCGNSCFLSNVGDGSGPFFVYSSSGGQGSITYEALLPHPTQDNYFITASTPVAGIFSITGPASTTMPTAAPELNGGQAGAALMLLAGIGLVMSGRRVPTSIARAPRRRRQTSPP
jgi:hypothetical protein